mmetsp:Transcript_10288/g.15426  ORF Transcript_10288/g.15426 Transcript_10288/m.15426 type:complete len:204 (-) Transcript_10288:512-1123(-)
MIAASRISSRCIKTSIVRSRPLHSSTKLLTKEPPKTAAAPKPPAATRKAGPDMTKDPHQLAADRVRDASDSRISGTEALSALTPEQKIRNYATALGLISFSVGIWYYSIQAVGKSDGGMDALQAEAQEAKDARERKSAQEMNAQDLAQIDVTMAQYGDDADDMVVAIAAPDAIAQQEEEALAGGKKKGGKPLWKKVVFFWKKE